MYCFCRVDIELHLPPQEASLELQIYHEMRLQYREAHILAGFKGALRGEGKGRENKGGREGEEKWSKERRKWREGQEHTLKYISDDSFDSMAYRA